MSLAWDWDVINLHVGHLCWPKHAQTTFFLLVTMDKIIVASLGVTLHLLGCAAPS